jgi:hypothetical protein
VPKNGPCDDGDPCTKNDHCENGVCKGDPVKLQNVKATVNGKDNVVICLGEMVNFNVTFDAENCDGPDFEWDFDDALFSSTSNSQAPTFTYTSSGSYSPSVDVKCQNCPNAKGSGSVGVKVIELKSLEASGATEIDDGDGNDDTKVYISCQASSGTITVNATIDPTVAEADLPASYTLTGGNGAGKLQRTVDLTTAGTTTITATCGSKTKTVTVHVVTVDLTFSKSVACDGEKVDVDIDINPAAAVPFITNVEFEAPQDGGGTTFDNPAGAGIDLTQRGTKVQWQIDNVRWFANQADQCNDDSEYEIKAKVKFGGGFFGGGVECESLPTAFIAEATVGPGNCMDGSVSLNTTFTGLPTLNTVMNGAGQFETTISVGTFARNFTVTATWSVTGGTASQFFTMVRAEELKHKEHYENPANPYAGTTFLVANVMNAAQAGQPYVAGTAAASQAAAAAAFNAALTAEINRSVAYYGYPSAGRCALETAAKAEVGSSHRVKMKCAYPLCP